ncbi:MAG: shikimate dehydrogenase [Bacteroidetes bacterium]|nr:shikimate dehydrogenase [Bacteroidota bacterium]MBU1719915.1 shikimate dehydrogenase [Bacteroidota bacterium]
MQHFGIIGKSLKHSFSEKFFSEKFDRENLNDCLYREFEIDNINEIADLIKNNKFLRGLNVTIPYKKEVVALMDFISPEAVATQAVNTIRIERRNGIRLSGYNTDIDGFSATLETVPETISMKALVLGNGGAAAAIKYVLHDREIPFLTVSRNQSDETIAFEHISDAQVAEYKLIINCTPAGMFPNTSEFPPLPYQLIGSKHILIDLIYNPKITIFLQKGSSNGAKIINGMKMLSAQAEAAWRIWRDEDK